MQHVRQAVFALSACLLFAAAAIMPVGCAFDLSSLNQHPATFVSKTDGAESFTLEREVKAHLGTGFVTRLNAGTHWHEVGSTEFGKVFATRDQIVTVEASDIYEAELVVSNQCITGFYLVVEKTFTPVTRPIPVVITQSNPNPK
jgi:hypothetical protein